MPKHHSLAATFNKTSSACLRTLTLGVLFSILQACSLFEPKPDDIALAPTSEGQSWADIEQQLKRQTKWQLTGKIGIRTPEESLTAAINNWSQDGHTFNIDLSSTFMGLGATKIVGNQSFITLYESGEDPVSSDQPDLLITTALGLPLPIRYLPYWVKGLPAPNAPFQMTLTQSGAASSITQHDWQIKLSKFQLHNGLELPGKIKLLRHNISITLAIKSWTLL